MEKYEAYLAIVKDKLVKAIEHLEYSYQKILKLPSDPKKMDEEILETWESFCARFCRVSDMFLIKYLKSYIKVDDPGFNGTFRDFLNQAEKLNLIEDVKLWLKIRELRNVIAHEYSVEDLEKLFLHIKAEATHLINIKRIL